ncbi:hypothetical protein, partial [Enterococcus faecium]|uniref:hypothetical protein n=1 Tax=Enterococcus faecium TaxID=1352 RepID=UPI003DA06054
DATRLGETERVKTSWENNLIGLAETTTRGLVIPESVLAEKDDIKFLEKIGIDFSKNTINLIESKDFDIREFKQAVTALRNY